MLCKIIHLIFISYKMKCMILKYTSQTLLSNRCVVHKVWLSWQWRLQYFISHQSQQYLQSESKNKHFNGSVCLGSCECRRLDRAAAEPAAPAAAAASSARWGQISPAGGALLPGCDPARLFHTRVWEVPWTSWYGTMDIFSSSSAGAIPAAMWFARTRRVESKVSWLAPLPGVVSWKWELVELPWNASVSGDGGVTAGLNDGSPIKTVAAASSSFSFFSNQSEPQHGVGRFGGDFVWTACAKLFTLFYVWERWYIVFYYCKLCAYLYSPRPT